MKTLDATLVRQIGQNTGWENAELVGEQLRLSSSRHRQNILVSVFDASLGVCRWSVTVPNPQIDTELRRDFGSLTPLYVTHYDPMLYLWADSEETLYQLLKRAGALSLSLPSRPLDEYTRAVKAELAELAGSAGQNLAGTETERLVKQRIGQNVFRSALMEYWKGACALSGLEFSDLLRASHCKPWSDCQSDEERLNPYNGLLLITNYDALFDKGWITFTDEGKLQVSPQLPSPVITTLGLATPKRLRWVTAKHWPFLAYHNQFVFKGKAT